MSHNRPANNVSFSGEFLDWASNNRAWPILAAGLNFAIFLVQTLFATLPELIFLVFLLYPVPWLLLLSYYWTRVWKVDFHVVYWYGIYRDYDTHENLKISTNTVSSLTVVVNVGPAVRSWTFRFSVPKECILVDLHRPSTWKETFNIKERVTCISSMRNESTFQLKFGIQARIYSSSMIQCQVSLEFASNTHETGIPSNTLECNALQAQKNVDFPAQLIPP